MTRAALLALVLIAIAAPARAHRLDEYLQATRVSIAAGRIDVEVDLTPGASVAADVLRTIDVDGNGSITDAEARAYARLALESMSLVVDGRPASLTLTSDRLPSSSDMQEGLGIIRLVATAGAPAAAGAHRIVWTNRFQPSIGAYLANALAPSDARVEIAAQERDPLQRRLAIDYRIDGGVLESRAAWSVTAAAMFAVLIGARRRRGRPAETGAAA